MVGYSYAKLLGKVKEVFGTQELFAEALGIGRTVLYSRLNGSTEWKQTEMQRTVELFHEPIDMICVYFFTLKVQKSEQ